MDKYTKKTFKHKSRAELSEFENNAQSEQQTLKYLPNGILCDLSCPRRDKFTEQNKNNFTALSSSPKKEKTHLENKGSVFTAKTKFLSTAWRLLEVKMGVEMLHTYIKF